MSLHVGAVVEAGTYEQLMAQRLEFAALVESYAQSEKKDENDTAIGRLSPRSCFLSLSVCGCPTNLIGGILVGTVAPDRQSATEGKASKKGRKHAAGAKLTQDEERSSGLVNSAVWWRYFKSPGSIRLFAILIFFYVIEFGTSGCFPWPPPRCCWASRRLTLPSPRP